MNTEELKLVLDTIREVAGTAGTVGMAWVVIHYLVMLAQAVVVPFAIVWCLYKVALAGFNAWRSPKVIRKEVSLGNIVLNEEVEDDVKRLLYRVRSGSIYVHAADVRKLHAALDLYEATMEPPKGTTSVGGK